MLRSRVRRCGTVALLCVGLVLGGCSVGGSAATTTTGSGGHGSTAEDPLQADKELIVRLWQHLSDASSGGYEAWLNASVDTAYPGSEVTTEQCMAAFLGSAEPPAGFRYSATVDEGTIEVDAVWVVPSGPLKGTKPDGRTYRMMLTQEGRSDTDPPETVEQEARVTVLDGVAYQFPGC